MQRLLEAFDDLWDSFVDPADALFDDDGTRWSRLGGGGSAGGRRRACPSPTSSNWPRSAPSAARWPSPTSSPSTATRTASATSSAAGTPIGPSPRRGRRGRRAARRPRCRRCSTSSSASTTGTSGSRRSSAARDRDGEVLSAALPGRRRHRPRAVRRAGAGRHAAGPRRRPGRQLRHPDRSATTSKPCWATTSTAGWSTPPRSSTARRTSTPT